MNFIVFYFLPSESKTHVVRSFALVARYTGPAGMVEYGPSEISGFIGMPATFYEV